MKSKKEVKDKYLELVSLHDATKSKMAKHETVGACNALAWVIGKLKDKDYDKLIKINN